MKLVKAAIQRLNQFNREHKTMALNLESKNKNQDNDMPMEAIDPSLFVSEDDITDPGSAGKYWVCLLRSQ